jgi:cytochrome d ubiquinol oxidase subunit I
VLPTFASFHIMVGLGMFFIAITLYASFLRWRGTLFQKRWLLRIFVFAVAGPFIANELGWVAAEVGRQPWSVHPRILYDAAGQPALDANGFVQYRMEEGLLTADAASEAVAPGQILGSIVMFSFIYAMLFAIWLYVFNHKIQAGPQPVPVGPPTTLRGIEEAAARRIEHDASMSEAKDEDGRDRRA